MKYPYFGKSVCSGNVAMITGKGRFKGEVSGTIVQFGQAESNWHPGYMSDTLVQKNFKKLSAKELTDFTALMVTKYIKTYRG